MKFVSKQFDVVRHVVKARQSIENTGRAEKVPSSALRSNKPRQVILAGLFSCPEALKTLDLKPSLMPSCRKRMQSGENQLNGV